MRSCGFCTACCTALGVKELKKAPGEPCNKLLQIGVGCSVYHTRPPSCRDFECAWLQGLLPENAKPEKSGVVFTFTQPNNSFGQQVMVAYEAHQGSFHSIEAQLLLTQVAKTKLIITVVGNNRNFLGPADQIRKAREFVAKLRGGDR